MTTKRETNVASAPNMNALLEDRSVNSPPRETGTSGEMPIKRSQKKLRADTGMRCSKRTNSENR
jgi:hypothetical protein